MQTYAHHYLPRLQSYQHELLERLKLLVNIDSGSGQIEGVNQIIDFLRDWMVELGFTVTLHPAEKLGNNLLAIRAGKGQRRLLLVGHVDTVYAPGSANARPFRIHDGLAQGPGVIDMKSGVLMGIYALKALIDTGFEDYGEISVIFNNDEEIGSPGSSSLLREQARQVDAALVLEPARAPEVITKARKGADRYILEIKGRPAHSGTEPFRGRSAVVELAHKILAIHNLHALLPGVTFNITRLTSSERLNVVPDLASCYVSVRAFDERGLNLAHEALEQIAAGRSVPDTETHLTRQRGRVPYEASPAIMRMVELAQAEGRGLNLDILAESKGGVSDANLLTEVNIPALDSLGPVGGGMHDLHREFLRIDSLPTRGALLAGLIHSLCLSESTGT